MKIEPLAVLDAWVCTPQIHPDSRGRFLEWFRSDLLSEVTRRRFDVQQANHSISHKGVLRGVHFADVPPGQAKYVYCPSGAALDVIVDLRTGSPTFGAVETVLIDDVERRGVFISEGLGHAFLALRDDTSVSYLLSATYQPGAEHGVSPLDPMLALPWQEHIESPIVSERDAAAPTLREAEQDGLLPTYQTCVAHYAEAALR
ncbi:MAG: dTDP-4-dehydrorhamnose 3,5-epimerase family protein [Mycobacteriales bacterium]